MLSGITPILTGLLIWLPQTAAGESGVKDRNIFLNGVDITGSVNQNLKKVNIHINDKGDIFITAPHYQAYEEDHYLPLSTYLNSAKTPVHKKPGQLQKGKHDTAVKLPPSGMDLDNSALTGNSKEGGKDIPAISPDGPASQPDLPEKQGRKQP